MPPYFRRIPESLKKFQPYLTIITALAINLVKLGYEVIRKLSLPSRKQSGNLLSSLFHLFAGLTEQLIGFRHSLLQTQKSIPWKFPAKKQIRQFALILAWLLFILSSFESTQAANTIPTPPATEQTSRQTTTSNEKPFFDATTPVPESVSTTSTPLSSPSPPPQARWLLLCTLRL